MRIAICDDQPEQLQQLRKMILDWEGENTVAGCFDNGDSLLQAHSLLPFDVIILDVLMPLLNGMETARELRQSDKTVKLVFVFVCYWFKKSLGVQMCLCVWQG